MQPNPPWADRIIVDNWILIESKIGSELMPLPSHTKKASFAEYGCGQYGCVYPTRTPGKVFKITSDMTEAAFISCFLRIDKSDRPTGIVEYNGVWEVPSTSHKKRSVCVLVREEATDVGGLLKLVPRGEEQKQLGYKTDLVIDRLNAFRDYADIARSRIRKSKDISKILDEIGKLQGWAEDTVDYSVASMRYSTRETVQSVIRGTNGARSAALALRACEIVSDEMTGEGIGYMIGETLRELLREGLLLADVHANNVGQVDRNGTGRGNWVITDPGHLVPLSMKWLDVQVKSL